MATESLHFNYRVTKIDVMKLFRTILASALILSSCATNPTGTASYAEPTINATADDMALEVAGTYNEVWDAAIRHVATTNFGIEKFEKASGLIILSFISSGLPDLVDGGHWTFSRPAYRDVNYYNPVPALEFDGNYAEWIQQSLGGTLSGRMNILVQKLTEAKTRVSVTTRYVVQWGSPPSMVGFNTGESGSVTVENPTEGTGLIRTFTPTHLAEKAILSAFE